MRFLALVAVFATCAPKPEPRACQSICGMQLDPDASWSCEEFQDLESTAILMFQTTKDQRLYACGHMKLNGYRVYFVNDNSFMYEGSLKAGITECDKRIIIVARGDGNIYNSALAHEMVHALQNCDPSPPYDEEDFYHSNWDRDSINYALFLIESIQ